MSAMKSEKLRQLRAGKEEGHAAFESGHDGFRNEMYHDSGFYEPGNEGDERDEQRRAGGERAKTHRIAARNLAERRADHERDGGSNGDGGGPPTAKNHEDQTHDQDAAQA